MRDIRAEELELGRIAYEAYCETTDWKSAVTGAALPQFFDTPEKVQNGWAAAAAAVEGEVVERYR